MLPRKLLILIFLFIELTSSKVLAFNLEEMPADNAYQNIAPLQVTGDALKWELFAKTQEKTECIMDDDGYENCLIKPIYSSKIKALDNSQVTITGFMFPLDATDKQTNFLIGPYPASCPFNYHVGPAQIIEVKLQNPIDFSYEPVTVKGVLSVQYNPETGIFYYLKGK